MGLTRSTVVLLALAAACTTGELAVIEVNVTPIETSGWAGSEIRLVSPAFTTAGSLPVVTVGQESLAIRLLAPETAAVRLPSAGGQQHLSFTFPDGAAGEVGPVQVYGFLSVVGGPPIGGRLVPVPGQGNPVVVGIGANGGLARLDLRTLTLTPLGSAVDTGYHICMAGIVPSADDPQLVTVARYPACRVRAVRLDNPLTVVDTGAIMALGYSAIHIGPGSWIRSLKQRLVVEAGGVSHDEACNGTFNFLVAAGATIPLACSSTLGVPVIDNATATRRYVIPVFSVAAAASTPLGDTSFVLAEPWPQDNSAYTLIAMRAANGSPLMPALSVPRQGSDFARVAVAVDPVGPWLYVAGGSFYSSYGLWLRVYDRRTLQQVGEIHPPAGPLQNGQWDWSMVVGADRLLYLTMNSDGYVPPERPVIYRISLPPN